MYFDKLIRIDDYTSDVMMFHQKFSVAPNKLTGWKRMMGQEVPVEAYTDLMSVKGTSAYSNMDLLNTAGGALRGGSQSSGVSARKVQQLVFGPQTPQLVQPALDLWVPLTNTPRANDFYKSIVTRCIASCA